ncbi:MAG: hypothetical protein ACRCX2_03725 [Paraclostridium sp.]
MKFRYLNKNEIQVKVISFKEGKGAVLALYKDARVDMVILDETVGPENWEKEYNADCSICTVSIYSHERNRWIRKQDAGECFDNNGVINLKGVASDSFKRACTSWGIGRELYTAPFIYANKANKGDNYTVVHIKIEDGQIVELQIANSKTGDLVHQYGTRQNPTPSPKEPAKQVKEFNFKAAIKTIASLGTQDQIENQLKYHKISNLEEANEGQLRMIHKYITNGKVS